MKSCRCKTRRDSEIRYEEFYSDVDFLISALHWRQTSWSQLYIDVRLPDLNFTLMSDFLISTLHWCQTSWFQLYIDVRLPDLSFTLMSDFLISDLYWWQASWSQLYIDVRLPYLSFTVMPDFLVSALHWCQASWPQSQPMCVSRQHTADYDALIVTRNYILLWSACKSYHALTCNCTYKQRSVESGYTHLLKEHISVLYFCHRAPLDSQHKHYFIFKISNTISDRTVRWFSHFFSSTKWQLFLNIFSSCHKQPKHQNLC
jgi:hypothetical protein